MYDASIYDQCWAFDHPFFFILNCAVGGNAAGEVSTDGWTNKGTVNGVTTWEDYYYSKFSAMESALAKLNSQSSSMSGLFGS